MKQKESGVFVSAISFVSAIVSFYAFSIPLLFDKYNTRVTSRCSSFHMVCSI